MLWTPGAALLAQHVVDLLHNGAATQIVPGIQHWLWKVTHEPQDDVPHCQGGLGEQNRGLG